MCFPFSAPLYIRLPVKGCWATRRGYYLWRKAAGVLLLSILPCNRKISEGTYTFPVRKHLICDQEKPGNIYTFGIHCNYVRWYRVIKYEELLGDEGFSIRNAKLWIIARLRGSEDEPEFSSYPVIQGKRVYSSLEYPTSSSQQSTFLGVINI